MEAIWTKPHFVKKGATESKSGRSTTCYTPYLHLVFGDPRGIRDISVKVNGQALLTEPYVGMGQERGLRVRLAHMDIKGNDELKVDIAFGMVGIESLELVPRAAKNAITLAGNWAHPSFTGTLPDRRVITDKQFEAVWDVPSASEASIHVAFVEPVNAYTQTDRAIKYGLLFIVLTFVAVGLFEVTKKLQVHPVQYLLVGSAVTIFFLLLLSLSEHLSFSFAYVLAATACVGLLTFYASHILGGLLRGTPFGGLMTVLYGMIYVLLSLEQTALLIGSLALFGALTAVMVLTRKVNWYELGK
jgi:inner membrane protein